MKKVFDLTNKYIIVATPLILFSLIISIYMAASVRGKGLLGVLFSVFLLYMMCSAFTAGWGKMLKSAATDKEPAEPNSIIKDFTSGVGEYFLPSCGLILIAFIFNVIILTVTYFLGMHFIGDIGISADSLSKAMTDSVAIKAFLLSLSKEQLLKLNMWNLLILTVVSVTYFVLLFYFPALFFETKNPLKALWLSVRKIFSKKFFLNLGIYLLIFTANFFISIFSALFAGNVIMNFIMTLINFYFISLVAIGIFYYYNETFIKPKLGTTVDTYI
jgi:flagellar biosynthesis protein FlhB